MKKIMITIGNLGLSVAVIAVSFSILQSYSNGSIMVNRLLFHIMTMPNHAKIVNHSVAEILINDESKEILIWGKAYLSDTYSIDGLLRGLSPKSSGAYKIKDRDTGETIGIAVAANNKISKTAFYLINFKGMSPEVIEVSK